MSLPSPNLDDRTFQQIVDDIKLQIGRRCPEWTDHNVSDPGVTLIELFAWMTEMTLFRLNQVPEKNYLKFLEMLGVSLEPPAPACTELRFRLSRAIEDLDGEEAFERTLQARKTVAATVRTEADEALEFSIDADLGMVRPRLAYVTAVPADVDLNETGAALGLRDFVPGQSGFALFSRIPRPGDAHYVGFLADVSGNLVELDADCVPGAATGLDEDYPAQQWETWNGSENRWDPLDVVGDTTCGFERAHGLIELAMPPGLLLRQVGGKRAYWIRCRYAEDLPPKGIEKRVPSPYQKPPEITSLRARVVGGTVSASNCITVEMNELGHSEGVPGQVFSMGRAPILDRIRGETVIVGEEGQPYNEWETWEEVPEFSQSGPADHHFVCDGFLGEIRFGPGVPQPDGSLRQHGAIPPKGMTVAFTRYRYGGGTRGNVAAGQVSVLKSSIPYIAEVVNPSRAEGGREQETLERAKMRGRSVLRRRDRAVTSEDFEYLACSASSAVGRARCVQPLARHGGGQGSQTIPPGLVKVLIVPALSEAVHVPRPADLQVPERLRREVESFLDERRLLTTVLEVSEPEYVYVSTDITLVADPKADPEAVARGVRESLNRFIHPLWGGPQGDGWPFRRALTISDLFAQVQAARGVAFLLDARIFVSRVANREEGLLSAEHAVPNTRGVRSGEDGLVFDLLCTREHRVHVRPIWTVGAEEG